MVHGIVIAPFSHTCFPNVWGHHFTGDVQHLTWIMDSGLPSAIHDPHYKSQLPGNQSGRSFSSHSWNGLKEIITTLNNKFDIVDKPANEMVVI